jgi:hypothetical protein
MATRNRTLWGESLLSMNRMGKHRLEYLTKKSHQRFLATMQIVAKTLSLDCYGAERSIHRHGPEADYALFGSDLRYFEVDNAEAAAFFPAI